MPEWDDVIEPSGAVIPAADGTAGCDPFFGWYATTAPDATHVCGRIVGGSPSVGLMPDRTREQILTTAFGDGVRKLRRVETRLGLATITILPDVVHGAGPRVAADRGREPPLPRSCFSQEFVH
jgi:hypothetical protein